MIIPAAKRLSSVQEYYFSRKLREIQRLAGQGREIINLGIGNPDLPPSRATVLALQQAASLERNHGYQPYRGIPELRRALADWYQQVYRVELHPEAEILPLTGSKEGIFHISMAFLNPGDRALVPDPGYPAYASAARMAGGEAVFYPLSEATGWLPDVTELRRSDLLAVKLMWLNYPHMPSGAVAAAAHFRELVEFAKEREILLCHDNPYSLILNPAAPLSILQIDGALDVCLELNSLSKSHHMAGWRIGMVAGQKAYLEAILAVKSNIDSGMFLPLQQAAVQALSNSAEWHERQNAIYRRRRDLVYRLLDLLRFRYSQNSAGLFVWGRAPEDIPDVEAFTDELLHSAGIFVAPGIIFGQQGRRYIRVSLCAPEERLQGALGRVQAFRALKES